MATRSLGTLTLDLVAKIGGFEQGMDKAGKASEKWKKQVKKDAQKVGKYIAAGSAAAAAGLIALTVQTVRSAEEIERLAAVSNSSSAEFQRYAAGARAVGVEQDKLADIFKDTTDRVGDFLQTGGGPMADFFENIAPQVGVTADEFRGLSGPQALGLYVKSLEDANVSQEEMTFYMEAMASDATVLLPLLRNNAEGFRAFADEAERAGAILDDETIRSAQELNAALFLAEQSTIGIKNQIAAALLPVLSDFAVELSEVSAQGSVAADIGESLATVLRTAAAAATGAVAAFQLVGKGIATLMAAYDAADINPFDGAIISAVKLANNFDNVKTAITVGFDDIKQTALEFGETLDVIWNAGKGDGGEPETNSRVRELAKLLADARAESTKTSKTIARNHQDVEAAAQAAKAALEEQQQIEQDYQNLLRELQTDEERITSELRERLSVLEAIQGIGDDERAETLRRIADAATSDAPEFGDIGSADGIETARTELQNWYDEQLELLRKFREERADLNATWDEEELSLRQQYEERLTEITRANDELRRQQQLEGYQAILDVAAQYYSNLEGEEAAYARAAIALGSSLLDERKRNALDSIWASTNSAAMGAYEALAPIPIVGPALGAAAATGIYMAGGTAAANVMGMAHDGIDSIPEDGTWLLQKGERVTTAETSAKLDRTLENIQTGLDRRGGMGGTVEQNIYVQGTPDRRTSSQIARDTERRQRMTAQRLGVGQ
ncbi:hypothetical protein Q2E61_09200 [Microbulbifer thermotolerans]|uniref:hypothetical protein n=1 Tax=Microbulbifer thermotolerans TaxID=252514 RepID=UPI002671DF0E|nr:hypothetical protein [Microbulbifer thermotolerans]WKT59103.1 hypothetical protein Q2E61_09200 [Microbulbifer thermotolerans]